MQTLASIGVVCGNVDMENFTFHAESINDLNFRVFGKYRVYVDGVGVVTVMTDVGCVSIFASDADIVALCFRLAMNAIEKQVKASFLYKGEVVFKPLILEQT